MTDIKNVFGRVNTNGNIELLHVADGTAVHQIDVGIYPVEGETEKSARWNHAEGLVVSLADAEKIAIYIED